MAQCPKEMEKIAIASFLYLERLANDENKTNLKNNENGIKNITNKIVSLFSSWQKDYQQFQETKLPSFTLTAKSNLDAVNFIETNKSTINTITNKYYKSEIKTKYDVSLEIEFKELYSNVEDFIEKEAEKIVFDNEENLAYYISSENLSNSYYSDFLSLEEFFSKINGKDIEDYELYKKFNIQDNIIRKITSLFSKEVQFDFIKAGNIPAKGYIFDFTEPSKIEKFGEFLKEKKIELKVPLEKILEDIKDKINLESKIKIISLIREKTNTSAAFEAMIRDLIYDEEFKQAFKNKEDIKISLTTKDMLTPFLTMRKKNEFGKVETVNVQINIDSKYKRLDDTLLKEEYIDVSPSKIDFKLKGEKGAVEIELDYEKKDVPLIKKASKQASKNYFYHSSFMNKYKKSAISIDESDSGAKGNKSNVLRKMAENAKNVILATGTFLDGYPKNIAYQMAYLKGIQDEDEFARQLTEEFGVFSFKNSVIKNLTYACMVDDNVKDFFYDTALEFNKKRKDKKESQNLSKIASDFTFKFIKYAKDNELLKEDMDSLKSTKIFESILRRAGEYIEEFNDGYMLLKKIIFDSRGKSDSLLKEQAGLESVFSFVQLLRSQKGGHINIATRELLHNVEEEINFEDLEEYLKTKELIKENTIDISYIAENNYLSALMVDAYLNYYAKSNYINSLKYMLITNFENFINSALEGKHKDNNLKLILPENMGKKEFKSMVSRQNISTDDSIVSYFKEYLNNNGEIPQIEDKKKQQLLKHLIKKFQELFLEPIMNEERTKYIMKQYVFHEKLSNGSDEVMVRNEFKFKDAYPYLQKTNEPLIFSIKLGFMKDRWKPFLKEPIEYKYIIGGDTNKEIMEEFASKGREKFIEDNILNKNNYVVGSSRTLVTAFNVCDAILASLKRENKNKPILLQVVKSSDLAKILSKVNFDYLQKNNIDLQLEPSSLISNEVNKAEARKVHAPIFGNIDAMSRGLDLSSKGIIIGHNEYGEEIKHGKLYTTGTTTAPNTLLQFYSRTFKPRVSESADINVFNGGRNVNFFLQKEGATSSLATQMTLEINERLSNDKDNMLIVKERDNVFDCLAVEALNNSEVAKITTTFCDKLGERALESLKVSKEFMSGRRSDRKSTDIENIVSLSEAYVKKEKQKNLKIQADNGKEIAI